MEQTQISITAYGLTEIGQRRKTNEDAFLLTDFKHKHEGTATLHQGQLGAHGMLLAVADGRGVAAAGEVASALAVSLLSRGLQHSARQQADGEQLRLAVEYANACIWRQAQQDPQLNGMGTSLTAALVNAGIAYLAQVGDSRAYLIRRRHIRQLTRNQSSAQKWMDDGLRSPAEAARHSSRDVIQQALGAKPEIEVRLIALVLERHDYLLLCSDGLSNKVAVVEMQEIVQEAASPAEACSILIELANARGGEDNISVIVAQFAGESLYPENTNILLNPAGRLAKAD